MGSPVRVAPPHQRSVLPSVSLPPMANTLVVPSGIEGPAELQESKNIFRKCLEDLRQENQALREQASSDEAVAQMPTRVPIPVVAPQAWPVQGARPVVFTGKPII